MSFFTARVRVERVPAWLLVTRPLVALDQGQAPMNGDPMVRRFILLDAFSYSMDSPAGAAAWIGTVGYEMGASDRMVTRVSALRMGRAVTPGMICQN